MQCYILVLFLIVIYYSHRFYRSIIYSLFYSSLSWCWYFDLDSISLDALGNRVVVDKIANDPSVISIAASTCPSHWFELLSYNGFNIETGVDGHNILADLSLTANYNNVSSSSNAIIDSSEHLNGLLSSLNAEVMMLQFNYIFSYYIFYFYLIVTQSLISSIAFMNCWSHLFLFTSFIYLSLCQSLCWFITSFDVIHSFGINALFLRFDAIPGRLNSIYYYYLPANNANKSHRYELRGISHYSMQIKVMIIYYYFYSYWLLDCHY